jgi:hypothetical protein
MCYQAEADREQRAGRDSLSLSQRSSFLPLVYRTFCIRIKLLRGKNEELLSFWLMGGPKKGPKIPEILFEIRTKKNLEQNLPFGESELELNRFPLPFLPFLV